MSNRSNRNPAGQLRIIGGEWRSRKIPFAAEAGVRPTPDRIRETLFNWLQNMIPGAHCLDLFAGSGALSFEALSRQATEVVMVDQDIRVIQQLQANVDKLKAHNAKIIWDDAQAYLGAETNQFDVVFLDPPFRDEIVADCCHKLEQYGRLADSAWIYIETDSKRDPPILPPNWQLKHNKTAGQISYHLALRTAP